MTGKFKDNNNVLANVVGVVTILVALFGGMCICSKYNIPGDVFTIVILMLVMLWVEELLLGRCSFIANDNKLFFHVGSIKHTYRYSEITSAETRTGFTRGRYGNIPYVEFIITLKSGDTVTFRDNDVPTDALSTPEKHKEFHDNHQFTKLSNYINQRL